MVNINIPRKSQGISLKKAATTEQNYVEPSIYNFDVSKVKTTVTNPSTKYMGVSVEDEQKIDRLATERNTDPFMREKEAQEFYKIALNNQKKKDIQEGRNKLRTQLQYLEENSNMKGQYSSQLKKIDLADLIRNTLGNVPLNINDAGVIDGFLKANPQFQEEFDKYYYDNRSSIDLGKDLGWIEQTGWDKATEKASNIVEGMVGWMPKFGEGVKDIADVGFSEISGDKEKALDTVAFGNYVQDRYGTYPANLNARDLEQAKQDFQNINKQEYTPTLTSGITKAGEGLLDIATTSTVPGALIKLGFSVAGNVPVGEDVVEYVGKGVSGLGGIMNKIGPLKKWRDSLQNEEEKKDFDMLVGGWLVSKIIKGTKVGKNAKYIDKETLNKARNEFKKGGSNAIDDLSRGLDFNSIESALNSVREGRQLAKGTVWDKIKEEKTKKLQTLKEKQAQVISQGSYRTRAGEAQELDILEGQNKLKNVKTTEELKNVITDTVDNLRKSQEEAASQNTKSYGENDLVKMKPQKQPDGTFKDKPTYPVKDAINELIEYYNNTDKVKAGEYELLLEAYNNGTLNLRNILDIKRTMNRVHNKEYGDNKIIKDTQSAERFGNTMEALNDLVEGLDMGENIRQADARLTNAYILRDNIETLIEDAADVEKTLSQGLGARTGRFLARLTNKLSFGFSNFLAKTIASYWQASIETGGRMSKLEISDNMKNMIKQYRIITDNIKNIGKPGINYETVVKDAGAFLDQIGANDED